MNLIKKERDETNNIDGKEEDETKKKKRVKSNLFHSTKLTSCRYDDIKKNFFFDHTCSSNSKIQFSLRQI